jgi:HSP20 family protein
MLVRYRPLRALRHREDPFPSLWNHNLFGGFFENFPDLKPDLKMEAPKIEVEEPKIEVKENDKNYLVRGEFPGYGKDEVKAEIVDGVLKLLAEHKDEKWDQNEEEGWRSIENQSGSYTRSFALPEDVMEEKVKATMKDGVLRITLQRAPKKGKEVKEIEIH